MEDATRLDAKVTKELLYALFVPERQNPLHDGAVVIRQGRVEAAGVFLPMSINPNIARNLGTCHRAALGSPRRPTRSCWWSARSGAPSPSRRAASSSRTWTWTSCGIG
ncbi:MAG: DNA integrity scanning protein DisA nucleotide-binding domain protein [bacterium]